MNNGMIYGPNGFWPPPQQIPDGRPLADQVKTRAVSLRASIIRDQQELAQLEKMLKALEAP